MAKFGTIKTAVFAHAPAGHGMPAAPQWGARRGDRNARADCQGIADHPRAGVLPDPMTRHHGQTGPEQPIEEAAIMAKLGECPGLLTGHGDRASVPMTRKQAHHVPRKSRPHRLRHRS